VQPQPVVPKSGSTRERRLFHSTQVTAYVPSCSRSQPPHRQETAIPLEPQKPTVSNRAVVNEPHPRIARLNSPLQTHLGVKGPLPLPPAALLPRQSHYTPTTLHWPTFTPPQWSGFAPPLTFRIVRWDQASQTISSGHGPLAEREDISRGIASSSSIRTIASGLGRAASTVSREVTRHGGRSAYRAHDADIQAWGSGLRPKRCLLASNRKLRKMAVMGLAVGTPHLMQRLPRLPSAPDISLPRGR
jgi:hypothetical protein